MITREEFLEWKAHPVTIEIFNELEFVKRNLEIRLGMGSTIEYNANATHGLTNKVVGQIEGLNQLLNITYGDDVTEEENENLEDEKEIL